MVADKDILDALLVREGGAIAPPDRSGRISRWGITAHTLSEYRGHEVSDAEIENLSATEARAIYQREYIDKPSFHLLGSNALRGVLVDYAVNSGPASAVRALQRCLGLAEDGIIGAQTLHAANLKDGLQLGMLVLWERAKHIAALVAADPTQVKYLKGWMNRIADQAKGLA